MIKAEMVITYTVTGQEFGLPADVLPVVTKNEAEAKQVQAELERAQTLVVLPLVTSHLKTYGRNGDEYAACERAKGTYGGEVDSVDKILARCGHFDIFGGRTWRDVPVALAYARAGRVHELGSWHVRFECTTPEYGGQSATLAAPTEEKAIEIMERWCPEYAKLPNGHYSNGRQQYNLTVECVQRPPAETRARRQPRRRSGPENQQQLSLEAALKSASA